MKYTRLSENYNKNILIPSGDSPYDHIRDKTKPYFVSMMNYNEDDYKKWEATGSVAGIEKSTTNKIWWDFDNKEDVAVALRDTAKVYDELLQHFKEENIQLAFSGNKGFSIVIFTEQELSLEQSKSIAYKFAGTLSTFDTKNYDNQRIFRLTLTKNEKSNLYKIPLTREELNLEVEQIKEIASDPSVYDAYDLESYYKPATVPTSLLSVSITIPIKKKENVSIINTDLDFSKKPKHLSNCRWALQNGHFVSGSRSNALLCLGATYKNQGFNLEQVYRLLKGVAETQAQVNDAERFDDKRLYNTIITQIFGTQWQNGQFTCKEKDSWLGKYCQSLGAHKCSHEETVTVKTNDVFNLFTDYAKDYDKNVLTTGIEELDKHMKFMVGTSNAILGPPGIGKTSIILQILQNNSSKNVPSILFSYDMFHSALFMRMVQKETGYSQEKIFDIFRYSKKDQELIKGILEDKYKNVTFCFKAGQTTQQIEETILDTENRTGEKVKLTVFDYHELITSDYSDATAASSQVAQRLRQIANERKTCSIDLLQPSKNYTSPSDEITSYNAAKGSSSIAQSLTSMLGCSRPGFNPRKPEEDKFFNITCLKNRNGRLFSLDFKWDGLRGMILPLEDDERSELKELRDRKAAEKEQGDNSWN